MTYLTRIVWITSLALSLLSSCGGAVVVVNDDILSNASVTLNAFSLGSDFPPDIQIPDIPGLESTAFVVTFNPPAVLPLDLTRSPVALSETFALFDASAIPAAAFPNNVWIQNPSRAFLLGSEAVIYFNPTSGQVLQILSLTDPIELTQSLPYSTPGDCNFDTVEENSAGPGPFSPGFPADMAVFSGRLFVTMSNACFDAAFESFYIQGILLVFDIHDTAPFLTPAATPFIVLPGFNATGITVLSNRLIVTSTGDTTLMEGGSLPETPSILTEIDPIALTITRQLNLGLVAANFQPLALAENEKVGFIGSSSFSEVYEIDLQNLTTLRGENDPIFIFSGGEDFISDQETDFEDGVMFVSSFNHSAVRAVDLSSSEREVLEPVLDFAFSGNPGVSGAGPMAVRPGRPGVDFTGPDLWVLTSSPGTVSNAVTY